MRLFSLPLTVLSLACLFFQPVLADPVKNVVPVPASASNPVVVELYTSQGCSSCPPADEALRRLATREDVLPLAFHVDYWDYIGWEDSFAAPEYTERQRGYARVAGRRMVYTPQVIIMGREDVVGSDTMKLGESIAAYAAQPTQASLAVKREGETLSLRLEALNADSGTPIRVQLIRFRPQERVAITRGELAGHTLDYVNVVQSTEVLADWNGSAPLALDVPISGDLPGAVVVQRWPFGSVLAAARID